MSLRLVVSFLNVMLISRPIKKFHQVIEFKIQIRTVKIVYY